jgi:hypothetical protein
MSMVMAFVTHQELGADASSRFLQGVAKGSFSYVASIFAFTEFLRTGNVWTAFLAALGVALIVQLVVQLVDSLPNVKRMLSMPIIGAKVALES